MRLLSICPPAPAAYLTARLQRKPPPPPTPSVKPCFSLSPLCQAPSLSAPQPLQQVPAPSAAVAPVAAAPPVQAPAPLSQKRAPSRSPRDEKSRKKANPLPPRSTSAHLRLALRDQKCRIPPEPAPLPPYYSAHTPGIRPSPLFRSPASKSLPSPPAQSAPIVSTSPAPAPPRGLLSGAEERWHSVTPDPFHCPQLADDELTSHRNAYLPHTHPRTHNIHDIPTDLSKREFAPWTITRYKIVAMDPDEPDSLPNAYSLGAMHRADAGKVQRRMKRAKGKGKGKGKGKENETGKELLAKIDRWHDPNEPFWGEQSDDSSSDDAPVVGFGALAVPAIRTERERRRRRRAEGRPEEDDDDDEG
ncbi:hypothetical protein JCM1841_003440 [Sporobolomyces salmonicolor]